MPNPVRIFKRKYDGRLKRESEGDLVDATAEGWLVVHHRRDWHETLKDGHPANGPAQMLAYVSVTLPTTWWLFYDELGRFQLAHCDVALPASRAGRAVTYIDLEIDLILEPDFTYRVRDIEEFERNRLAMGYPEEVVAEAWRGLELARCAAEGRLFPLDGSAERLLGRLLAAEGPL